MPVSANRPVVRLDDVIAEAQEWRFPDTATGDCTDQIPDLLSVSLKQLQDVGRYALEGSRYTEGGVVVSADPLQTGNESDAGVVVTTKLIANHNPRLFHPWAALELVVDNGRNMIEQVELVVSKSGHHSIRSGVLARTGPLYAMIHGLLDSGTYFGRSPVVEHADGERQRTIRQAARILGACAVDATRTARYLEPANLEARARAYPRRIG